VGGHSNKYFFPNHSRNKAGGVAEKGGVSGRKDPSVWGSMRLAEMLEMLHIFQDVRFLSILDISGVFFSNFLFIKVCRII
jgi:hypothetical protein